MIIQNMIVFKCFKSLLAALVLLISFAGCYLSAGGFEARTEFVLGAYCTINLFEDGDTALYGRLFARLAALEEIFSANREDSQLARVNQNAGLRPVEISPELFIVLKRALYFAEASEGAFDPTIGPLVKLWGINTQEARIPGDNEIASALELVNWRDLELAEISNNDPASSDFAGTAFLKRQGMALDLGAIAKGYAADELVFILREMDVKRALIDLGGDIYIWGNKAGGEPWFIGIQDPLQARGIVAGILELEGNVSVVSSGDYQRFFTGDDGKRYHHILELGENAKGRRGYPVENLIHSTTVIAFSSMDADALSTICFILGFDKGLAFAALHGAEVLYIERNVHNAGFEIRGSPGAMAVFTPEEDVQ